MYMIFQILCNAEPLRTVPMLPEIDEFFRDALIQIGTFVIGGMFLLMCVDLFILWLKKKLRERGKF